MLVFRCNKRRTHEYHAHYGVKSPLKFENFPFKSEIIFDLFYVRHCNFTMRNLNSFFHRAEKRSKRDRPPEELSFAKSDE